MDPQWDVEDVQSVVALDPQAIEAEYARMAASLAYWGAKYATAARAYLLVHAQFKAVEASLGVRYRAVGIPEVEGKPVKATDDSIKAAVIMSAAYQDAQLRDIEAQSEEVRLNQVVKALHAKKDMLQSLGAHVRAEWGSDPATRRLRE